MNSRLISSLTRWTELGDHASPLKMRTVVPLIFKVTNSRIRNCGERFLVTSRSPLMQNLWPCAWCVFRRRVRSAESFGSTICTWLRRYLRIDFRGAIGISESRTARAITGSSAGCNQLESYTIGFRPLLWNVFSPDVCTVGLRKRRSLVHLRSASGSRDTAAVVDDTAS